MSAVSMNGRAAGAPHDNYKWIALSNTTLGILMAVINQSIVIIALPAIFRGIPGEEDRATRKRRADLLEHAHGA